MADGYARLTGKVQCVIVHVDVGTQALAAAVHNPPVGRVPVLIFAGLSPITREGEVSAHEQKPSIGRRACTTKGPSSHSTADIPPKSGTEIT